jgi:hypothetical protein
MNAPRGRARLPTRGGDWIRLFIVLVALGSGMFLGAGTSGASDAFILPQVASVTGVVPTTTLTPETNVACRARTRALQPPAIQVTMICYAEVAPLDPLPPPFYPAVPTVVQGTFDDETGEVSIEMLPCTEFFPELLSASVNVNIQLEKGGGPASGSVVVTTDGASPFDCADGTQDTDGLTLTPLAQGHDEDNWGPDPGNVGPDGCTDWEELGTAQGSGGLRDPFNFWDFYDVPTGSPPARDKVVAAADLAAVVARFGSTGDPAGNPLSAPPAAPAYHTAYGRGGTLGPNQWNLSPANGAISGGDIAMLNAQYGHTCVPAP